MDRSVGIAVTARTKNVRQYYLRIRGMFARFTFDDNTYSQSKMGKVFQFSLYSTDQGADSMHYTMVERIFVISSLV